LIGKEHIVAKTPAPIPVGFTALTPYLRVRGAKAAITFYKTVFGAKLESTVPMGDKLGHAEMTIGGAKIALADEFPEMNVVGPETLKGSSVALMHYCLDADAVFAKAVAAGAKVVRPLTNEFYGDRVGTIEDPFGHVWMIHTHIEDVAPEEINRRMAAMMASGPPPVATKKPAAKGKTP
jgi:PhnB protein